MDSSIIRSQLTTLKKRVKAHKEVSVSSDAAESKATCEAVEDGPLEREPQRPISADRDIPMVVSQPGELSVSHIDPPEPVSGSVIKWSCQECSNECIPVMRESRCLCGHRLKEHKATGDKKGTFSCASRGCRCKHFFFLVAEGAWILRCRCKHKHIEHDCGPGPHKCTKCAGCSGFDSPWVCNCGHTWASHKQYTVAVTERNAQAVLGGQPNKKQHFYRQDGLDDEK